MACANARTASAEREAPLASRHTSRSPASFPCVEPPRSMRSTTPLRRTTRSVTSVQVAAPRCSGTCPRCQSSSASRVAASQMKGFRSRLTPSLIARRNLGFLFRKHGGCIRNEQAGRIRVGISAADICAVGRRRRLGCPQATLLKWFSASEARRRPRSRPEGRCCRRTR